MTVKVRCRPGKGNSQPRAGPSRGGNRRQPADAYGKTLARRTGIAYEAATLTVRGSVNFLIDTGADSTVIHASDGMAIGIPFDDLNKPVSHMGHQSEGIGLPHHPGGLAGVRIAIYGCQGPATPGYAGQGERGRAEGRPRIGRQGNGEDPNGRSRPCDNPCRGVERSREEPRDRTLNPTDIAAQAGRSL